MGHHVFVILRCLAVLGVVLSIQQAGAQEPHQNPYLDLPDGHLDYPYVSREQELGDALRVFSRNLQIAVSIDEGVTGTIVESDQSVMTRQEYLNALAEEFGFVWYFDGILLNIVDVSTFRSEVFPLLNNEGHAVIAMLKTLDIYQPKFLHRADEKTQTLMVMGPESYVSTVGRAVQAIESSSRKTVTLLRGVATEKVIGSSGLNPSDLSETVDSFN